MKISQKLYLLASIPMLAILALGGLYAYQYVKIKIATEDTANNVHMFISISGMINEVQKERGLSNGYLASGDKSKVNSQRPLTDSSSGIVNKSLVPVKLTQAKSQEFSDILNSIERMRNNVDQGTTSAEVMSGYSQIVQSLMEYGRHVANLTDIGEGLCLTFTSLEILEDAKENAGLLRGTLSGILKSDKAIDESTVARISGFISGLKTNMTSRLLSLSSESRSILNNLQSSSSWKEMEHITSSVIAKSGSGNYGMSSDRFWEIMSDIIAEMTKIRDTEFRLFDRIATEKLAIANGSIIKIIVSLFALIGILSLAVLFVIRSITSPIGNLVSYSINISHGRMDVPAPVGMTHEMGALRDGLMAMIKSFKEMLAKSEQDSIRAHEESVKAHAMKEEAEEAKAKAERAKAEGMLHAADQLEEVVTIVSNAVQSLKEYVVHSEDGANHQAKRITQTATAMEKMNNSVVEVAQNAGNTAEVSTQTREKAENGANVAQLAIDSIQGVREQSLKLKSDMAKLDSNAKDITAVMSVISDIADQTNLLALNAAIEAARAGEAGRGFAVVADEVRKLAEKTMTSTNEVGKTIASIQKATDESTRQMDMAVNAIEEATQLVNQSGTALQEIVTMADTTAAQIRTIATAAEEQSETSDEINRSLADINTISQDVVGVMRQSANLVQEVATQSDVLLKLIDKMKKG